MALLKTMIALLLLAIPVLAVGKLPAPTPAQAQLAAEKKAQAQAAAEKDKLALNASMDALSARWRSRAATEGWKLNPPVSIAAPLPALMQPNIQAGASGQPGGVMGAAAKAAPVTSEKSGTAVPSKDVKTRPTPTYPQKK
jgi:Tfp pilus assembly protein PilV